MSTPTPPIDLTHLKALEAKATPGPWKFHELDELSRNGDGMGYIRPEDEDGKEIHHTGDSGRSAEENRANGEFTTALRNAFPQLCRELEAAREDAKESRASRQRLEVERRELIELCQNHEASITSLQSQLSKADGERDRMREALETMLASAHPHPTEHKGMFAAWEKAKAAIQPLPQTEGREVVKPTVTQEEYLLQLFTNWCECSPYGEQIPDKWPELMADFVKKHKGKDRDAMAELFAEGDPGEPFEKLLESIFVTSCQFVLSDLSQAVDDGDTTKLAIIGFPAPVSEKGPVDSPEGLRPPSK
jgi:hypothetical protein